MIWWSDDDDERRDEGFWVISSTCCFSITWSRVKPAVSGDTFMAMLGGREKMSLRSRGKCLKRTKAGPEASIASTIGAW